MPVQPSLVIPTLLGITKLVFGSQYFTIEFNIRQLPVKVPMGCLGVYPFSHPYLAEPDRWAALTSPRSQLVSRNWLISQSIHNCQVAFDLSNSDHLGPFIDRLRVIVAILEAIVLHCQIEYVILEILLTLPLDPS